ncbi:hypothetical protein JHK87_047449 [Glycine soja]|nr:hypothetical protein JHK87_047449 [Glycine soja]
MTIKFIVALELSRLGLKHSCALPLNLCCSHRIEAFIVVVVLSLLASCHHLCVVVSVEKVVDMSKLRSLACQGIPDVAGSHSIAWKVLLGYLPPNLGLWYVELAKKRSQYKQFKEDIFMNLAFAEADAFFCFVGLLLLSSEGPAKVAIVV